MEVVKRKEQSGWIWKNYEETRENEEYLPRKKTRGKSFRQTHYDKHHE
jgi:hypothetical protein